MLRLHSRLYQLSVPAAAQLARQTNAPVRLAPGYILPNSLQVRKEYTGVPKAPVQHVHSPIKKLLVANRGQ